MARAENLKSLSGTAGAVVRIYRFVQLQADGKFDECGTADDRADGLAVEAAAADGDTFAFAELSGIGLVEAGAAVSVGDLVATDTQGRAITASAAGSGQYSLGVALSAAAAAGEVIEVLLHLAANQA